MACTNCQAPKWKLLTPKLEIDKNKIILDLGEALKKAVDPHSIEASAVGVGNCKIDSKSRQLSCARYTDDTTPSASKIEIEISDKKFRTTKADSKNSIPIRQLGKGTYGTVYEFETEEGEKRVIKIMHGLEAQSAAQQLIQQVQKNPEFQKQVGYFLLESIFSKVMGECKIAPECYFVGIVEIDSLFYFGMELERYTMDLYQYLENFPDIKSDEGLESYKKLESVTSSIYELCRHLGTCGIVWWDTKPLNIVVQKSDDSATEVADIKEVRFIDFDAKYLVRIEGQTSRTLTQINFLLFVTSCTYFYSDYRKNFLDDYLSKKKFPILAAIRGLSILTKSICKAVLKEKYPEGHVQPHKCFGFYAKAFESDLIDRTFENLNLQKLDDDIYNSHKQFASLSVENWMHTYTLWGDFQNALKNEEQKEKQRKFDESWNEAYEERVKAKIWLEKLNRMFGKGRN